MTVRIQAFDVDTTDSAPIARWWSEALGRRITHETADEWVIERTAGSPEDGVAPDIVFASVPEAKRLENRMQLDLWPCDELAEITRFVELRSRRVPHASGTDTGRTRS